MATRPARSGSGHHAHSTKEEARRLRHLGTLMQHWHASMGDPIYAAGSYYFSGERHPSLETEQLALEGINRTLRETRGKADREELLEIKRHLEGLLGQGDPGEADLALFTDGYIEAAIADASHLDQEDGRGDRNKNYTRANLAPETRKLMEKEARAFYLANRDDLLENPASLGGYHFWMTRNGAGVGFWDGDWSEPAATRLSEASKAYGEAYIDVSRNKIHQGNTGKRHGNPTEVIVRHRHSKHHGHHGHHAHGHHHACTCNQCVPPAPADDCGCAHPAEAARAANPRGRRSNPAERETLALTGASKSYEGWGIANVGLGKYLTPGDVVDEAMVAYGYEVVPPRTMTSTLVQIGEAYDHRGEGGRPRYTTFQNHAGEWIYTGVRIAGEHVSFSSRQSNPRGRKPKGPGFVTSFKHRGGEVLHAEDYGLKAFPIGRKSNPLPSGLGRPAQEWVSNNRAILHGEAQVKGKTYRLWRPFEGPGAITVGSGAPILENTPRFEKEALIMTRATRPDLIAQVKAEFAANRRALPRAARYRGAGRKGNPAGSAPPGFRQENPARKSPGRANQVEGKKLGAEAAKRAIKLEQETILPEDLENYPYRAWLREQAPAKSEAAVAEFWEAFRDAHNAAVARYSNGLAKAWAQRDRQATKAKAKLLKAPSTPLARPAGLSARGNKAHAAIVAFLKKHKLTSTGGATRTFYSPIEWAARGESGARNADLIVVYEGGDAGQAFAMDQQGDDYAMLEAMQTALKKAGVYSEELTGWASAVYPITAETKKGLPVRKRVRELKHERNLKQRAEIERQVKAGNKGHKAKKRSGNPVDESVHPALRPLARKTLGKPCYQPSCFPEPEVQYAQLAGRAPLALPPRSR